MYNTKEFLEKMINNSFYPFLCVPCSGLSGIINCICEFYPKYYYPVNNEGEAIAIGTGLYLQGKKPVIMIQNSGIGNMLDPITSLLDVYEIPLVFLTSWRGIPKTNDEKQHITMGNITEEIYSLCNIECLDLVHSKLISVESLVEKIRVTYESNNSISLLVNRNTFLYETTKMNKTKSEGITTHAAMKIVLKMLEGNEKIVSSTGYLTRELNYLQHTKNNFYMVGSMGCALSIGLGLAIESRQRIVVLDGDGAVLMRLEGMASIGHYRCSNLLHIIFENDMYESTGRQPNMAGDIKIETIAKGCGYKRICICENAGSLYTELEKSLKYSEGAQLIIIKVLKNNNILERGTINYKEIRDSFLGGKNDSK